MTAKATTSMSLSMWILSNIQGDQNENQTKQSKQVGNGIVHCSLFIFFIACDEENHTHEWEWVETEPATYDTNGLETETCKTCGATNGTRTIAKFKTEQPFTIGSVNFIFEYRRDDTTSWDKFDTIRQTFADYMVQNADTSEEERIADLAARIGAEYRIIVDYSDTGKAAGFVATDAQTLTVGSDYLANTTLTRAILRNAFAALYAKPWPIP